MDSSRNNKVTASTLLIALGIIYGDIGTSPLYTFKAIIGNRNISEMLVLGGVSCIFWTLMVQTSIKYVWLTLKADNEGEGGIFSLYSLVRKYGKRLIIPTMIGASALLADGVITPAVTVTSAVEGLSLLKPLKHISVVPLVVLIVSVIFFFQRFGSERVGKVFGPVMAIWFGVLFILGLAQILQYPHIIRALNPMYAYDLLIEYPNGFWLLGAVFLCTTGAEALYSDLGHCGRANIRITWIFVKISLITNYLGQAAWLMQQKQLEERNPFFEIMPSWFLIPGIIVATFAAIIASQALISGSFTLINEAINLNFWQRVVVKQPTEAKGQIYVPSVNFILWLGCLFIIFYFKDSAKMEAAYGMAITITMLMTTLLLSYFLVYKLRWSKTWVYLLLGLFLAIELSFFTANLVKFTEGGYITVLLGCLFFGVMYTSFYGRKINNRYTKFVQLGKYSNKLIELSEDSTIPKYSTHLIYLTKADSRDQIEEVIVNSIFSKKPKRADVYWFFHINRTNKPYTLNYEVSELIENKVIKIVLNIGFRIQPRTEFYFRNIFKQLIKEQELNLHLRYNGSSKYNTSVDYKFVVIEKYMSIENEFNFNEKFVLQTFFSLKKYVQRDEKAFGLDRTSVLVEEVPLVYHPMADVNLERLR